MSVKQREQHAGQPADIAGPALFLCGEAASFIHGETLFVDGGWNAAKGY